LPGHMRWPVSEIARQAEHAAAANVGGLLIFGLPQEKDHLGRAAADPLGPVPRALRALRAAAPDLALIADVCLCEYTTHGHRRARPPAAPTRRRPAAPPRLRPLPGPAPARAPRPPSEGRRSARGGGGPVRPRGPGGPGRARRPPAGPRAVHLHRHTAHRYITL